MHREEAQKQNDLITNQFSAVAEQCKLDMQTSELDPIRHKVELVRPSFDSAPPFEFAVIDDFPTEAEKAVIAKWGTLRDECVKRNDAISNIPPDASAMAVAFKQKQKAFYSEAEAQVGELIVALYHSKLTYGEFAKRRYEVSKYAADAEREYREAMIIADQQRQQQAQLAAQQQFQNNLAAWSIYMQSVNARQPQTVYMDGSVRMNTNCISQRYGNTVSTNCN
ncbi:hypothetical protein GALL_463790 [mine drainage metagenome]|uniref:Uncharacterized protein n=1 Tax=mine drainage metagenome TaxID=410659 RepID=A0A1J5PW18_9ZZZZ